MAKKRIKNTDIFDPNWLAKSIAEMDALLAVTKKVEDNIKGILKAQQKALKKGGAAESASDYKEQANNIKLVALAEKELIKIEGERQKLLRQKKNAEDRARKAQQKSVKVTKQSKDATKAELIEIERARIRKQRYKKEIKSLALAQEKTVKSTNTFSKALGSFGFKFNFLSDMVSGFATKGLGLLQQGFSWLSNNIVVTNQNISKVGATFGLARDEAKLLNREVSSLAGRWSKDFNDILKTSKILAEEFGVSSGEALALINDGFEKGADLNGEYLELLKEYPAQLKQVGLSAKESIAFITQSEQAGVFSDKGVDAIKEAGIRLKELTPATRDALDAIGLSSKELEKQLRDGSISLFDVIQKVSGKLGELPENSAEVGTAIADIFGGPGEDAGLRYLKTLKDIDLELTNLPDALSDVEKATADLGEEWGEFTTKVSEGDNIVGKFFTNVKESIAGSLKVMNSDLIPAWQKWIGFLSPAITEAQRLNIVLQEEGAELKRTVKTREELLEILKNNGKSLTENKAIIKGWVNAKVEQNEAIEEGNENLALNTETVEEHEKALQKLIDKKLEYIRQEKAFDDEDAAVDAANLKEVTDALDKEQAEKDWREKRRIAKLNKQYTDEINADIKAAEDKLKIQKEYLKTFQTIMDEVDDIVQKQFDKKQAILDKEIEQSKAHQEELKALAQKGVEDAADNLAFEQKKQAELELQKAKDEKKLQAAQMTTEFLKIYSANAENDPNTALSKTVKEIFVVRQAAKALASLDKGTENTNQVNQDAQVSDGKGGFLAVLHPEERVLNKEQNKMVAGISNEKLAQLGREYKQGGSWETNQQIINKFDNLEKAIDRIQKPDFTYDKLTNAWTDIIKTRNKKINTHKKVGKLFN